MYKQPMLYLSMKIKENGVYIFYYTLWNSVLSFPIGNDRI